ncbi:hypothetical protein BGZ99_008827 [Dissophora globulifera]|uniref:RING-type domain-containing protein n=1 Tax=Dissophora globulifera TaxID=979702 RepID=A0A9P6UPA4_9FUNG|nr:hypothetical protein BGZ99_008827 [Dissophora globulifera]
MTVDTEVDSATRPSLSKSDSPPPKRPKRNPSVKCPICHEIVAPGQYQQHYRMELASLEACTSMDRTRGKRGAAIAASKQFTKGKSRGSTSDNERLDLLRDIQKRRTARQNNKDANSLSTGSSRSGGHIDLDRRLVNREDGTFLGDDDAPATCFICNERLFGSLEDINAHIDACLTNPQQPVVHNGGSGGGFHLASGTNTPTSERGGGPSGRSSAATTPNDRAADSFEEYTWAGQTRIRATALFEGGMGSLGSGSRVSNQEDIDDDLNVEDDEEDEYGDSQFTERDVVVDNVDADAEELREIVLESSVAVRRAPSSPSPSLSHAGAAEGLSSSEEKRRRRMDKDVDIEDEGPDPGDKDDEEIDEDEEIDLEGDDDEDEDHRLNLMISSAFASGDTRLVIDALRSKIKHLESASKSMNAPSCLICLEPYTVPLTSIVCWHVHCEACWMKTLGSKKLCPQCQKITLPKDLRRIYL